MFTLTFYVFILLFTIVAVAGLINTAKLRKFRKNITLEMWYMAVLLPLVFLFISFFVTLGPVYEAIGSAPEYNKDFVLEVNGFLFETIVITEAHDKNKLESYKTSIKNEIKKTSSWKSQRIHRVARSLRIFETEEAKEAYAKYGEVYDNVWEYQFVLKDLQEKLNKITVG